LIEIVLDERGVSKVQPPMISETRCYRGLMLAPTSFFADYACHLCILEEIEMVKFGKQARIAVCHDGDPVLA
jgi:hypothetical protein